MRIRTQRALDRVIGTALCGVLSLFPWRYARVPPGFIPRRILVIILSEMGSLVLAKPMFDSIRERYPEASIYLLVLERNKELLQVLYLVPQGNILTVSDRSFIRFLVSNIRLLSWFRRIRIDTVIDCELFSRISSLYSLLCGGKVRVGFHPHTQEGLFRGGFLNRPIWYNPYVHVSRQFLSMLDAVRAQGVPLVKKDMSQDIPRFDPPPFDPEEVQAASTRFHTRFPHMGNRKLVLLYPGGGLLPIRAWPLEYYGELAKGLLKDGHGVGIIGKAEDKKLAQEIVTHCRDERCLDLTGYTERVKDLILLFHLSSLLITNDGGPGHFASLTPIQSIVLFGPETPRLYGSLSQRAHFFFSPLACSPCLTAYNNRNSPCDGNNLCLKAIPPKRVLDKARELLRG